MTRIIAGIAGGRRIAVPPRGTRPTTDRVREAMFSSLDARLDWPGLVVLDLYAGSGALGLEALSRGATRVVLVESHAAACAVIARNVASVGLPGAEVIHSDVAHLATRAAVSCDLVLMDPPYDVPADEVQSVLVGLESRGWIAPYAEVVVERPSRDSSDPLPTGWLTSHRSYGETRLWYGQVMQSVEEA